MDLLVEPCAGIDIGKAEHVALAAREDLEVLGVDQLLVEAPTFEHVPHGLPRRAGRLHRHLGDTFSGEPIGHRFEVVGERGEGPGLLAATDPLLTRYRKRLTQARTAEFKRSKTPWRTPASSSASSPPTSSACRAA